MAASPGAAWEADTDIQGAAAGGWEFTPRKPPGPGLLTSGAGGVLTGGREVTVLCHRPQLTHLR